MIDTKQIQTVGSEVAKKVESEHPILVISFSASPVRDEENQTYVEVLVGAREGSMEKLFEFGVIDHSTAPNAFRFQQVFEKAINGYVRQFLGVS